MSYILEALKKADKKRKLGRVPDVYTVHDGLLPTAKRLLWPYILVGGLFFNAGLVVLWLHAGPRVEVKTGAVINNSKDVLPVAGGAGKDENGDLSVKLPAEPGVKPGQSVKKEQQISVASKVVAQQGMVTVTPMVGGKVLVKDDKESRPVAGAITEAEESGHQLKAITPKSDMTGSFAAGVVEAVKTTGSKNHLPGKVVAKDNTQKISLQSHPLPTGDGDFVQNTGGSVSGRPKIVERIGGQPLPDTDHAKLILARDKQMAADRQALAKVPFLRQLPDEFRRGLPQIHISFLSYSYAPAKRLVSIDGVILREGQELGGGLKVEKITPVGVVLTYKKRQFKVDLVPQA